MAIMMTSASPHLKHSRERIQAGALAEHAARADGVVADFAVAHVLVGRHAHGGAVRLEFRVEGVLLQPLPVRLEGGGHEVPLLVLADAGAIHDGEDDGAAQARETLWTWTGCSCGVLRV